MRNYPSSVDVGSALERNHARLIMAGIALMGLLVSPNAYAQLPGDLPWPGSTVNGQTVIVQAGIAAATCGTTTSIANQADRFTFGLWNIDGVIPAAGHSDETASAQVYHHPSWVVTDIGNVFGVAINERTGDIFLSASSNYGVGYFEQPGVIQYGSIGGGAASLAAAGTVYRVDAVTGQASVFAVLPQQSTTFNHVNCEQVVDPPLMRTTGVGLGNIHYDSFHDQYFVTNTEDGRIYRLGPGGAILDSFDPGIYDDGVPGISVLTDLAYGVAVEPGGSRLFFGGVSTTGTCPIRSIDLTATGGFDGVIDDTNLPAGATWSNYVGVETFHTDVTVENPFGNGVQYCSDLHFTSGPALLAGVRVGCDGSWFNSYSHGGESDLITPAAGLYNSSIFEFDVTVQGFSAAEDAYGGVSDYTRADSSVDYVVTSSDIVTEDGPHGLAVFLSADTADTPIDPLAAISYGPVDTGDPKGVGGSVDVFSAPTGPQPVPVLSEWGAVSLCLLLLAGLTIMSRGGLRKRA